MFLIHSFPANKKWSQETRQHSWNLSVVCHQQAKDLCIELRTLYVQRESTVGCSCYWYQWWYHASSSLWYHCQSQPAWFLLPHHSWVWRPQRWECSYCGCILELQRLLMTRHLVTAEIELVNVYLWAMATCGFKIHIERWPYHCHVCT